MELVPCYNNLMKKILLLFILSFMLPFNVFSVAFAIREIRGDFSVQCYLAPENTDVITLNGKLCQ